MSLEDTHDRIKARIWKAVAQSELDLSPLTKEQQETLVDLVASAAILEADSEVGRRTAAARQKAGIGSIGLDDSPEQVLWEGRPLLSISTRYVITNERVRIVEGILGKDREDIELIRIQDMDQAQTLGERLLNVGDISIRSHDTSHPEVTLNNVRDPQAVHEVLRRAVFAARKNQGLIYREEM